MDPASIRAFAERSRAEAAHEKRAHWARLYQARPESTWEASLALREHMARVRPDYPTERDRAEDLAHHVRLKALLDRASRALAAR